MARTYYSASDQASTRTTRRRIDSTKLSAAVKYWNKVDVGSEYWLDALFEESWAYFMAGDYPHALGNIHTIEAPYFPNSFYPEADILKAVIYFTNCNYDDATTIVARFKPEVRADPQGARKASSKRFKGENQEEPFFKFLKEVRDGKANLPPTHQARRRDRALRSPAAPQHRVRARARRGADERFKKAPASVPELGARRRRDKTRCSSRAISPSATPASSRASATSATSTSSTSTCATARRSSSTSPPRSATSSTRRSRRGR